MEKDEKHNELQGGRGGHSSGGTRAEILYQLCHFWHGVEWYYSELLNVCMKLQKNTEIETFLV